MEDKIYKYPDDFEILNAQEYKENISEHFLQLPNVSNFLIEDAQANFNKIEKMLYSTPAVVDVRHTRGRFYCVPLNCFK